MVRLSSRSVYSRIIKGLLSWVMHGHVKKTRKCYVSKALYLCVEFSIFFSLIPASSAANLSPIQVAANSKYILKLTVSHHFHPKTLNQVSIIFYYSKIASNVLPICTLVFAPISFSWGSQEDQSLPTSNPLGIPIAFTFAFKPLLYLFSPLSGILSASLL